MVEIFGELLRRHMQRLEPADRIELVWCLLGAWLELRTGLPMVPPETGQALLRSLLVALL